MLLRLRLLLLRLLLLLLRLDDLRCLSCPPCLRALKLMPTSLGSAARSMCVLCPTAPSWARPLDKAVRLDCPPMGLGN